MLKILLLARNNSLQYLCVSVFPEGLTEINFCKEPQALRDM